MGFSHNIPLKWAYLIRLLFASVDEDSLTSSDTLFDHEMYFYENRLLQSTIYFQRLQTIEFFSELLIRFLKQPIKIFGQFQAMKVGGIFQVFSLIFPHS